MKRKLLNLFSLKWNPFSAEVPVEGIHLSPSLENFCYRIENAHIAEGGFAAVTGEPGTGKSVTLRLLAERLGKLPDLKVGVLTHPSSNLADFYREMGELFGVPLRPHNRWGGFKALRQAWVAHIETTLYRPVLLIDEAQELAAPLLSELRLLSSTRFDSRIILSVILAGDTRLLQRLGRDDLAPIRSRIRTHLELQPLASEELLDTLRHLLEAAGNPQLMTRQLLACICDHSRGNLRTLSHIGSELLTAAAREEVSQIDEKLFFQLTGLPSHSARSRRSSRHASTH